jgi:hypothetical protein
MKITQHMSHLTLPFSISISFLLFKLFFERIKTSNKAFRFRERFKLRWDEKIKGNEKKTWVSEKGMNHAVHVGQ